MWRALRRTLGLVGAASIAACRIGAIEAENDRLRDAAIDAEARVAALEAERDELRARLVEAGADRPAPSPDDAAIPRLARLAIREPTTLLDDDDDGAVDGVRVRVRGLDGRARDLQLAGPLEATVVSLGDAAHPARTVGVRALTAIEVRDAYRASPFGTHYVLEIAIDPALVADGPLAVRVRHHDLRTGADHEATSVVSRPGA